MKVLMISTDVGIACEVGAYITDRNHLAENIVKYVENKPKIAELTNYLYKNRQDYLDKFKESCTVKTK